jgi:hypothetical protein
MLAGNMVNAVVFRFLEAGAGRKFRWNSLAALAPVTPTRWSRAAWKKCRIPRG